MPRSKAGVSFEAAALIWGIGGGGAFSAGMPWGIFIIALTVILHGIASWFFRIDDRILQLYENYASTPDEYRAGNHSHGEISKTRPKGYGKEVSI